MSNHLLTDILEIDINIINRLSDEDLQHFHQVNKYAQSLYYNDYLWQLRIAFRYGQVGEKPAEINWYEYYIILSYYPTKNINTGATTIDAALNALYYNDMRAIRILSKLNPKSVIEVLLNCRDIQLLEELEKERYLQVNTVDLKEIKNLFVDRAALKGHIDVLDWFDAHGIFLVNARSVEYAINGGHIDVLYWLEDHGFLPTVYQSRYAFRSNNLPVAKWFYEHGYPIPKYVYYCDSEISRWIEQQEKIEDQEKIYS